MTRTAKNSLVLDGSEVKFRLEAERLSSKTPVHVDWVRFTCLRRNAPYVPSDLIIQDPHQNIWDGDYRERRQKEVLRDLVDGDFDAAAQAYDLALFVSQALGPDFSVGSEYKKGHDFYKFRWCILRNDTECGWVGFLASGDSPRQKSQAMTIHANVFGMACTFAAAGWRDRLADLIESRDATLTRCDLALDMFNGFAGGMQKVLTDYNDGAMNVGGKFLKCNQVGDWSAHSAGSRSFYFGSREAGKETNVYEKGDQLYGPGVTRWMRAELRYGNKLRVLPVDMLRRPADFFAGASDWHAAALREADFEPSPSLVECAKRLPIETIKAECARSIRWLQNTAAASAAAAFAFLDDEQFLELVSHKKLPGRLAKFKRSELADQFTTAFGLLPKLAGSPTCAMA